MVTYYRSLRYACPWVLLALTMGFIFAHSTYNVQGGLLVLLATLPIGFLLIRRMAKVEDSHWLLTLLALAFLLKLGLAAFRMNLYLQVYGALYDAGRYHHVGTRIAEAIWRLDFASVLPYLSWGTPFTEFYSGLVHAVVGPTVSGAYLVFGLLAFVGSIFFYRAFCIAFPHGDRRIYAVLAFFYPSILFWANGLGKDALISLFMGLAAYGSARLLIRAQFSGLISLTVGLVGMGTVRPHVAAMIVIALLAAFLLRKSGPGYKALLLQGLILIAGVGLAWFFVPKIIAYTGLDEVSLDAATEYYNYRQGTTGDPSEGGAAFQAPSFTDPLFVPKAFITALFRPFPWEAHNILALVQALDGILLLGLMVWRGPRLVQALLGSRSSPYVIYILVFTTMLTIALMTIANFGTLARERTMLLPLLLMLLAFRSGIKASAAPSPPVESRP